tara:strand:- start:6 stop:440 length:435 start_codon:yes stop_codon:yes gene_type:complete
MDNLITCTNCSSDACYVEEVNQEITTYFCYGCGFQSNSLMIEGHDFLINQTEVLPELYKDLLSTDKNGMVWMPSSINIEDKGMVFANGTSISDWKWAAVKAVKLEEGDKKLKENQTHKVDMDSKIDFDGNTFMDALSYIGLLPE